MTGSYSWDVHQVMTGTDELRAQLKSFLTVAIPPVVDAVRAKLGVDEFVLPYPKVIAVDDPYVLTNEQYPAIGFVLNNDRNHTRTDNSDSMESEYWIEYSCRLPVVCLTPVDKNDLPIAPRRTTSMQLAQRMVACLKNVLLSSPSLGDPDNIELVEGTLTTEYIPAFLIKKESDRYVSQGVISVDIRFRQWTYEVPYGTEGNNNEVNLDVQKLV